jgi:hypothetical protein
MKKYLLNWVLIVMGGLALLLAAAEGVLADSITILNPSFEADQPGVGWSSTPAGYYTNPGFSITGWTYNNSVELLQPNMNNSTWFNYPPPDGANVAYLANMGDSYIYQILTATWDPNAVYLLRVEIAGGSPVSVGSSNIVWGLGIAPLGLVFGERLQLPSRDIGTGNFTDVLLIISGQYYTINYSDYAGAPLEIVLGGHNVFFDNIRLEVFPPGTVIIPLPPTLLLLGSGILALVGLKRSGKG